MKFRLSPFLWSGTVMVMAMGLGLYAASEQKILVEAQGIGSPDVSAAPAAAYFFGVVAVLAVALFLVPMSKLRWVFRGLFTLMYAWGVLVLLWLVLPFDNVYLVYAVAAASGLAWLLVARIWLQNLLLLVTLSAGGSVFGFFFSPLTFLILMLVIGIYDLLAVRFGFMVWIADKMSEAATLPAFIFPRDLSDWDMSVYAVRIGDLARTAHEKREYSILGGGDIAFPLMLSVSVFFESGISPALVVGALSLAGLMAVFAIQATWLRGKPVPALPPIAAFSVVGFLIARFLIA